MVSVIIRNHNEREYIGFSIQSVLDFIPNAEIIVIDDHSTDDSLDVVKLFTNRGNIKLFKIDDYNFGGVIHLLGSLKDDIYIKAIVLHLIVTRFGGAYATNISKAYGTELDEGEELYKNYTGHKFNNLL